MCISNLESLYHMGRGLHESHYRYYRLPYAHTRHLVFYYWLPFAGTYLQMTHFYLPPCRSCSIVTYSSLSLCKSCLTYLFATCLFWNTSTSEACMHAKSACDSCMHVKDCRSQGEQLYFTPAQAWERKDKKIRVMIGRRLRDLCVVI